MMNSGDRPPFHDKSRLVEEIQSWSPQIREYYEKFGKKRDLEQYFLSHTYERRPPVQIVDSLELLEGQGCDFKDRRRKTYPEKEIRFETMKYEKQSSPDVEIREVHGTESSPSPRISLRSDTPALDVSPEQDFQDSAANAASPGTLSTSKKLEWDSLGDVGYDNARRGKEVQQKEQEYKYQCEDDKRNKISPVFVKELNYKVGDPTAHSTPNMNESSKSSLNRKKSPEKSPRKPTGIYKKSEKYKSILSYKSNRPTNLKFDVQKYYSFNIPTGEKSQYEEIQSFHIDAKVLSPEGKNVQPKEQASCPIVELPKETKTTSPSESRAPKTDREMQTTSKESVSMSVQTSDVDPASYDEGKRKDATVSGRNEDFNIDLSNVTRGSPNTLSRAESFEYIPGSVYENAESARTRREFINPENVVQVIQTSPSDIPPQSSVRSVTSQDIIKIFEKSTSSQDVGDCIHKISKLLRRHTADNPSLNKKVVKKIVKILMQANYPSDNEAHSAVTTPSSSSRSIQKSDSTGESCNELNPADVDMYNKNNKRRDDVKNMEIIDKVSPVDKHIPISDKFTVVDIHEKASSDAEYHPNKENFTPNTESVPRNSRQSSTFGDLFAKNNDFDKQKENIGKSSDEVQFKNEYKTEKNDENDAKKTAIQYDKICKILETYRLDKVDYRDGVQSAPTTLTYSHYLKKKAESVHSIPSTSVDRSDKSRDPPRVSKSRESIRKSKEDINTDRSSYRDLSLAAAVNDTQSELIKINEEILKLTVLKLKLENKHRPDTLQGLATDFNTKDNLRNFVEVDKGGSGDMTSRKPPEEPVLVYYNTVVSPTSEDDCSPSVPPLDLIHSSSSACSLDAERAANTETSGKESGRSSSRKSHQCSCGRSESQKSKNTSDPRTSECRCERGTVRFVDSTDSVECDNIRSTQEPTSKSSSSTSCGSGLCACCRCKAICSQSSSAESCTAELRKYRKINEKYQKCKTMRAFVREYDELIKKYQILKEKRLAQSSVKSADTYEKEEECPCDSPTQKVKRSPVGSCMKKTDATTCTATSHRSVCCGNENACISKATSPIGTPVVSKTDVSCQNQINSDRSAVSERLLGQVRKAFAKEYEDITRRLDNIKCNCECMIKANTGLPGGQKPVCKPSCTTDAYSSATSTEYRGNTSNDPKCKTCVGPCLHSNTDSMTAMKSDGSEGPLPLSSQEYIMLSQEDVRCKCKEKCTCSKTSSGRQSDSRSKPRTASSFEAKSYSAGISPTSRDSAGTNREKISSKKSQDNFTCLPTRKSAPTSKTDLSSSYDNIPCNQSDDTSVRNKKCKCCAKAACSKSKLESTEPASSARSNTHKSTDSTYTKSFQKIIESKCPTCPGRCNCKDESSAMNKDCVKGCVCKKCRRKQEHIEYRTEQSSASQSVEAGGCTFRKCKKCSVQCKCVQQVPEQNKCTCIKCQRDSRDHSQSKRVEVAAKKDKCQSCCSKCACKKKKDVCLKKQEDTSDDSVVMCLWCKAIPMNSSCRICNGCLRRHQQYVENVIQRKKYICKSISKSVAYNLIVESSESILEETVHKKPKCLEKVVVKVAKVKSKKNDQRALDLEEECCQEEKGSTDEQIRELSSLNSEQKDECENQGPNEKTLRDMLEENRPDFVCNTNCRQEILKKYNAVRQQRDAEQRRILLKGVRTLPTIDQDTLNHLECIAREYGLFLPKSSNNSNFKVFDSKEMVKAARRKYQKLPEVEKKKLNKKKQDYKKTNLVMASIFSKKLQRKTLRGILDISHSRQVISL